MKQKSQRQVRVAQLIREEVANRITRGESASALITPMVNITAVDVSPDLKHASIYFDLLAASTDSIADVAAALNAEAPAFQKSLACLGLKFTPRVRFHHDAAFASGERIDTILRRLGKEQVG